MKNKTLNFIPLLSIVLIIVIWYGLALIVREDYLIPSPLLVSGYLIEILGQKSFYMSIIASLGRIFLSFFIGLIVGVGLAILSGINKIIEKIFYPLIVIIRAVPTMSIIFLCIIWFWYDSKLSPIFVSLVCIIPLFYASTLEAIKGVNSELVEMSSLYKVSKKTQILRLYLPSVASRIFADSISILAFNVKLIISAEALSQTSLSIGKNMFIAKESFETAQLLCWTIVSIILSYILEIILKVIKKYIVRWNYVNC